MFSLAQDYKALFFDCYINEDMDNWKTLILEIEAKKSKNPEQIAELVNYQYGYIAYCIGNTRKAEAEQVLLSARKNISLLEKYPQYQTLVYSYKSAFIGFEIGISPYKAPFLASQIQDFINEAFAHDSSNYRAHLEYANIQFYTPKIFGGSKSTALKHYLLAEKHLVQSSGFKLYDWNYINLLTLIGQSYQKTEQFYLARQYYLRVLRVAPSFNYVKCNLLKTLP